MGFARRVGIQHRARTEKVAEVLASDSFEKDDSVLPRRFVGFVFGEVACAPCYSLRERYIYFTAGVNATTCSKSQPRGDRAECDW